MFRIHTLAIIIIALSAGATFAKQVTTPKLEEALLVFNGEKLSPVRVIDYSETRAFGPRHVITSKGSMVQIRNIATDTLSQAKNDNKSWLSPIAVHEDTAYLIQSAHKTGDRRIRRLNLATGEWMDDLTLESEKSKAIIVDTYIDDEYLVVATTLSDSKSEGNDVEYDRFGISCFVPGKSKAIWNKVIAAETPRSYSGPFLLSARNPDYATEGLTGLARFEDRITVAMGGKQPFLCLNIETGTELWRCDRIWEFQRGFIGPSVWQHFIGRFRINPIFEIGEESKARTKKESTRFYDAYECSLIGGPAIVAKKGARVEDGYSIFMAVSKQPKVGFGGYLGASVIYELNEDGEVISLTNLPRLVNRSKFYKFAGGVVWHCQGNQLAKLEPAMDSKEFGAGPGGFDHQTKVGWIRSMTNTKTEKLPWLQTSRRQSSVEFAGKYLISVNDGGFVSEPNGKLFQFPIMVTDLNRNVSKTIYLNVPFSGSIPTPLSNYSKSGNQITTVGSYLFSIANVSLGDDIIRITAGSRDNAKVLEFKLYTKQFKGLFAEPEESLNDINETEANISGLSLRDAAKDHDDRRIKLMLKRGDNIDERSENGWSALMISACYGSKDVVKCLIENGANVDFADNNCGGQTTLMWAVSSSQSSKRKVKMLIEKGADIWKKTDGGRDLLMSAAGSGNIEVVEMLLALGMKPTAKAEDGNTALMSAAREGSPKLIEILLNAGAELEVVDKEGKSALLFAADNFDQGETLKALLAAGADPTRKDKKGRTALDYCKDSNNIGSSARAQILKIALEDSE